MKKKIIMKLAALFMTGILAVESACARIGENTVYAAETDVVESESDGADSEFTGASGTGWTLYANGFLKISGDPEYEEYEGSFGTYTRPEWNNYREKITEVKVEAFKPKSTANWFCNCNNIKSISFAKGFGTSNVTDMCGMFQGCESLERLDVSDWDTSNVTNMSEMFDGCENLTSLDVSRFDTSKVTDMHHMFCDCYCLASLDLNDWDTSSVTNMSYMFEDCHSLTSLDLSDWDTSNVTDMRAMFSGSRSFGFTSLNLSGWDTSNVTNMREMFRGCENLTSLDINGWNTSKVTDMCEMFTFCGGLTSLDVAEFDTSNVINMENMFFDCRSLKSLDVSDWNTSHVTNMNAMFFDCSSLTSLDVSRFDTSKVTDMLNMFLGCSGLENLDVSGFDTSNAIYIDAMFGGCDNLTSLDVSGWDTSNIIRYGGSNFDGIFDDCKSIERIKPFVGFVGDLELPLEKMYDINGTTYTTFPKGLTEPMTLYASVPTASSATSVSMKKKVLSIETENRYKLSYTFAPLDCTDEPVWTSSDSSVVSVNSVGMITSHSKEGTAVITISLGSYSDSCEVTVRKAVILDETVTPTPTPTPTTTSIPEFDNGDTISTKSISGLPKGAQTLDAGGSVNLKPVVKTADGANVSPAWLAPVGHVLDAVTKEDGSLDIKAVGPGTAYVTVVSGTKTKTVKYTVKQAVKTVDASVNAITLGVSEKYRLCVIPDAPTTDKFYFESSDKSICSVDQKGLIKAKKTEGSATITIYAYDKKSEKKNKPVAKVDVKVEAKEAAEVSVTDASINYLGNKELYVGEMGYISTLINGGTNNGGAAVKYMMDNKGIVKIDTYGHVTAKKAGIVTITATCGEKTDSITLTVKQPLKLYKVNKSYVKVAAPKAGKSSKKVTFTVKTNPTAKKFIDGGGKVIWTVTSKDTGISLKSDDGKGKAVFEVPSGASDTIVTATISDPVTGKSYSTDCMIDVK